MILYFGLIRPIQEILLSDVIVPEIYSWSILEYDVSISYSQDDLKIESKSDRFIDTRISLPFSAYYFLAIIFFYPTLRGTLPAFIHIYNLALIFILPILSYSLVGGIHWLAPLINAHEMAYKALFLSIGMLGLKDFFSENKISSGKFQ